MAEACSLPLRTILSATYQGLQRVYVTINQCNTLLTAPIEVLGILKEPELYEQVLQTRKSPFLKVAVHILFCFVYLLMLSQ